MMVVVVMTKGGNVRLAEVETCPFVSSYGREDAADRC